MTRIYSDLLSMAMESYQDKLFTFDYEIPDAYKPVFERKFLLRFGYRNIQFDSYQMFKHMLESKLADILPRYLKLYESENVEFNPFVNTRLKTDNFQRDKGRRKNVQTANSKNHNYNNNSNSGSSVSSGGTTGGYNENAITSNHTVDKQRGINDRGSSKLNLYADTPQTQVQTQGAGGDGASASDSGSDADSDKYFNEGYITEATRDRESATEINSASSNGWANGASERGQTSYGTSGEKSDQISQGRSLGGGQVYSDSEGIEANQRTQFGQAESEGLNGVLMSDAVVQWRKTFINIDAMLLDELEDLFIGVF